MSPSPGRFQLKPWAYPLPFREKQALAQDQSRPGVSQCSPKEGRESGQADPLQTPAVCTCKLLVPSGPGEPFGDILGVLCEKQSQEQNEFNFLLLKETLTSSGL